MEMHYKYHIQKDVFDGINLEQKIVEDVIFINRNSEARYGV